VHSSIPMMIVGMFAGMLVEVTVSETQPVPVYNGSFEIPALDRSGLPDGWKLLVGNSCQLDGTVAHDGKTSLILSSAGAKQEIMTHTTFAFEPHRSLHIRIWSQSELKRGKAALVVYWFDQSVRNVGSQALELSGPVTPWTENSFVVTPPASAARLGFHIELSGNGKVWLDELTVTQMPEKHVMKARGIQSSRKPIYMPVDISKNVNMAFIDERDGDGKGGWTDQGDNDLRNFPRGRQMFVGVPFDILDPESHGDKAVIMLGSARNFPNEITISPVPKRFDVLHILHAAAWINNGKAGEYVIRYADGTEAKTDVVADVHLADWWYPVNLSGAPVAWFGSNRIRDLVGVWLMSWVNPNPQKDVASIVLRSTRVVVGICGMTTQEGGPLPTERKLSTIQITLEPESLAVNRGQPLKAKATIYHGTTEAMKIRCELAMYRGSGSDKPLHSLTRELTLDPKQVGLVDFAVEKIDVPVGSYRLVCIARGADDSAQASIPVAVMPESFHGADVKATKFYGYGMMYIGAGIMDDFRRIKQGGFDWIAPDLQWQDLEPQPGVYNWAPIDQYIETAKAADIKLGIKTLLFAGISWFDKDLMQGGVIPSNFSTKFAERYTALWQAIIDRYKDEPTIFAWCPTIGSQDNPVGYLDSDTTPAIKSAWRKTLQRNGWTLEKVSSALGEQLSSWDKVDPPTATYANTHGANDYFRLFLQMRKEKAVELYSRLCQTIRAKDPNRPIMLKMGQPWPLDVYDAPNGLWPTGWMQMCRKYDARLVHSNFEDTVAAATLPSMAELYGVKMMIEEGKTPPSPPTTVASVGHGAKYDTMAMEYCVWPAGRRLADWTRLKPVVYRMLEFDREYDNLWVASLQDNLFATSESWPQLLRYNVKFYDLLTKAAFQYHVTDSENIPQVPVDAVLIDANCTRLDDASRRRIDEYVRRGGTYVGQFLTDSEANYALYTQWGFRMKPHMAGRVSLMGTGTSCLAADGFVPEGKDTRTVIKWEDGQPAAVVKKIGAGRIIVAGCGFEGDVASSAGVLQALLAKFGVRQNVKLTPYGAVEVSFKRRGSDLQIGLINRAPTAQTVTIALPRLSSANAKGHDWLDGKDLERIGDSIKVKVDSYEIRLLELSNSAK